jgi:glycogen(starch) synthase
MTMHGTERTRHSGQLPAGTSTDINSIEWWVSLRADRLIASTRLMVEQLVTHFELDGGRVLHIPNGIDPDEWRRAESAISTDARAHIVAWGNVQYEKGFQVLARAVNIVRTTHPEIRCTIAGRGRYLAELQTQLDVEGVSDLVELPGYVPFDALRRTVHGAACVVVPSLFEPFGIVALEALAAGAPLIVADTGGLAELIDGTGAGLTFEPGSPDALAATIVKVLDDGRLARDLVARAYDLVDERYTWSAIARRTSEVYQSAIDGR